MFAQPHCLMPVSISLRGFVFLTLAAICCPRLGLLGADAGATVAERDVALWVMREGGRVRLDGATEYINDPFELPAGEVHLVGIDMHGTLADPKELEPLRHLTGLRELLIPARVWSPASDIKAPYSDEVFDFFSGMNHLETFQAGLTTLAWLDLWDTGLVRMASLAQLKDLRVSLSTMKDPKSLAPFVNLEFLDLSDTYVTDQTMTALAGMKNLRRLTLLGTLVTDEGIKYLQDLTQLEGLDLYGVKITDKGLQYLRKLTKLKELNLLGAQITDESAATLAQFRELRALNLYRSRLTNAGLTQLQQLPHLELLDVRYTGVNRSGVEAVRAARPDCKIAFVSFAPPGASARGNERPKSGGQKAIAAWIRALGGDARVANGDIQSISVTRTNFTDAQLAYLKALPHIERLNLEATDVSDAGLVALTKLVTLRELNLSFTSVSDRGLANLGGLVNLRRLVLSGVRVEGAGIQSLDGLTQVQEL